MKKALILIGMILVLALIASCSLDKLFEDKAKTMKESIQGT